MQAVSYYETSADLNERVRKMIFRQARDQKLRARLHEERKIGALRFLTACGAGRLSSNQP
jgi:hypothetical protein